MIEPSIDPRDLETWAGYLLDHSLGGIDPGDRVMIKGERICWPLMEVLERRVIEAMDAQLADDFSLAQLARTAELSEYHFSRMFKRATGLSPSQYFIGLRMARARRLLIETQRSVIDIGLEVGYSSASHFSQVFRREVGVTPSAYRQA